MNSSVSRYAFTPIVDFGDDDDDDENMTLSDAFGEFPKTVVYFISPSCSYCMCVDQKTGCMDDSVVLASRAA